MTEQWWQEYKKKKERNKNLIFDEVESEIKRRFKSEKSPEEMYQMCKTDNNYWKQIRLSENLDDESVGLVLCKGIACDMMYCQALTFSKNSSQRGIETFGCKEQFDSLRQCYINERRIFNKTYSEEEWRSNKNLISEYLRKELQNRKETQMKYGNLSLPDKESMEKIDKVLKQDDLKVVGSMENQKIKIGNDNGYF
jgi:hypothetical protein